MTAKAVEIREERPDDVGAIRALNLAAFGRPQEGALIDALRTNGAISLSLVAAVEGRLVGQALYSPVSISLNGEEAVGAGLGPMAVIPEHQRKGIGGDLIRAGIRILRTRGCPFIVVLGHPEYYPRFGFRPAAAQGIGCQWNVPQNAFMILTLDESRMKGGSGLAKYRPEFSQVL
jgi:putative acetyltransferase